jgi:Zn-dependent peptidase ImmA (M78 family)/DNA-binding Xre family transcriptional regulator
MSRIGVQGFQHTRLCQVLAARRLSQVQLASMVGVSPSTLSKWRSGTQAPEREKLERLAEVVNVMAEWFLRPCLADLSLPLFRSAASAHVAARGMLQARLEWAQDIAMALEEFVDFPDVNLPVRQFTTPEQITSEDIEEAAEECRERWGLGRAVIEDLSLATETAGILVVREETGVANIEGLSAWSRVLDRPFIFLSADKDNGYRSRFDLAHEIGHLVLHRGVPGTNSIEQHKILEQHAHRFAGALLLPAESFAAEIRLPPTLDDLLILKRRWGVSVGAMIMRLSALELIDDDHKLALHKRKSYRWGGKGEPGDGDRPPEKPRLIRRTIDLLLEESIMPLATMPRHFGLSATDLEMLAGLTEGFFEGKSNVLQFAKLKQDRVLPDIQASGEVLPFRKG